MFSNIIQVTFVSLQLIIDFVIYSILIWIVDQKKPICFWRSLCLRDGQAIQPHTENLDPDVQMEKTRVDKIFADIEHLDVVSGFAQLLLLFFTKFCI